MSFTTEDQASTASSYFYDSISSAFSSLFPTAQADEGEDDEGGDDKEEGGDDKEEGGDDKEEGGDDKEEEEGGEEEGGEDEDDDEPEDPMPAIYESCENSKECTPAKHHFQECQERVQAGKGFAGENCVEEFFHLAHCASTCTAPRLFNKLV